MALPIGRLRSRPVEGLTEWRSAEVWRIATPLRLFLLGALLSELVSGLGFRLDADEQIAC